MELPGMSKGYLPVPPERIPGERFEEIPGELTFNPVNVNLPA
jgi:hypothetical protein